jgi:excisionase family DNA binding protein
MKKPRHKTHLTPKEVSELLMVNPVTLRQWAARGLLRSQTTPGGHRRYLVSDVDAFARSRGTAGKPRIAGRPDRVLIIDDNVDLAQSMVDVIRSRDAQVECQTASDGFEAGTKVESFRPDVLVLDLMMPGIDGFEVCRLVRSRPTLNHLRIIAITGFPSVDNVRRIMEAGADACLTKPVNPEQLLAKLGLIEFIEEKGTG